MVANAEFDVAGNFATFKLSLTPMFTGPLCSWGVCILQASPPHAIQLLCALNPILELLRLKLLKNSTKYLRNCFENYDSRGTQKPLD